MKTPIDSNKILPGILVLILWLGSVAIGLYILELLPRTTMLIYAFLTKDDKPALFFSTALTLVLALGLVIFAILTAEFHLKRIGTRASWKLFLGSYLGEAIVIGVLWLIPNLLIWISG